MTHMGDLRDETNVVRHSKLGDLAIEMPVWKGDVRTKCMLGRLGITGIFFIDRLK